MTPAVIAVILQYGIEYGIPAAEQIIALFKKPNPTIADIEALFAQIKTYDSYIAAAKAAQPGP